MKLQETICQDRGKTAVVVDNRRQTTVKESVTVGASGGETAITSCNTGMSKG